MSNLLESGMFLGAFFVVDAMVLLRASSSINCTSYGQFCVANFVVLELKLDLMLRSVMELKSDWIGLIKKLICNRCTTFTAYCIHSL